uniref:Uncharacterized protein n=1 Tax=Anguilla anguilla TaxID=7936 RepID=A0A0E9WF42_ANGAN
MMNLTQQSQSSGSEPEAPKFLRIIVTLPIQLTVVFLLPLL